MEEQLITLTVPSAGVTEGSMHSTNSMRTRRTARATATTMSASVEDDFSDQFEDDLRRLSVAEDVQRDFKRVVVASSAPSAATSSEPDKEAQKLVSAWCPVEGRAFGVELETLLYKKSDEFLQDNAVKAQRDVVPTLKQRLGPHYDFRFFDYQSAKDDREYKAWKITTDLSIRSEDGRSIFGLEFVTPKMIGGRGLYEVETVADELQRIGFATNNTTALHVHVSVEDLTNEQILRLCEYQAVFETVIDQFMTVPRRGDYSRYCRSNLRSMSATRNVEEILDRFRKVDVSRSINPLIRFFCPRLSAVRNSHRNHKVNLLLLARTKRLTPGRRIEFRQHQGSCDRQEIGAWVSLLLKWVATAHKLPRPGPREGTVENFWKIIDDPQLKTYYTVKMQTLPTAVDFTYDSRELYSYNQEEIEPSDLDDPEEVVPRPVLGSPRPTQQGSSAPPSVSFAHAIAATAAANPPSPAPSPNTSSSSPQAAIVPPPSAMLTAVTSVPVPPQRRELQAQNFVREALMPLCSALEASAFDSGSTSTRADSMSTASSAGAPPFATSMMAVEHDDRDESMMREMMQRRHEATRRSISQNNFSMGNHMFSCAIRVEAHYYGEGCVSFDQVVVTDPSIIVTREANTKDPRNWYITSPTDASRTGRRAVGIRWISPWLTEARGLETAGRVVDYLQDSCQLDEETFFFVHVAVNHKSNAEIGQICAAVATVNGARCQLLSLELRPNTNAAKGSDAAKKILDLTSAASGEAFPNITELLRMHEGPAGMKLVHLSGLTGTVYKAPKRELVFEVGAMTTEQLAQRAAFLSFFCSHCSKKLTPASISATQNSTVQQLIALVDTLPASLARSLAS